MKKAWPFLLLIGLSSVSARTFNGQTFCRFNVVDQNNLGRESGLSKSLEKMNSDFLLAKPKDVMGCLLNPSPAYPNEDINLTLSFSNSPEKDGYVSDLVTLSAIGVESNVVYFSKSGHLVSTVDSEMAGFNSLAASLLAYSRQFLRP